MLFEQECAVVSPSCLSCLVKWLCWVQVTQPLIVPRLLSGVEPRECMLCSERDSPTLELSPKRSFIKFFTVIMMSIHQCCKNKTIMLPRMSLELLFCTYHLTGSAFRSLCTIALPVGWVLTPKSRPWHWTQVLVAKTTMSGKWNINKREK